MRFISLILATYIFSLTAQPAVTEIISLLNQQTEESCGDNCCNETADCEQTPDKQDPSNCCPNGICNPFEQCACCSIVTVASPALNCLATIITSELTIPASADVISNYTADCFHPPEIV